MTKTYQGRCHCGQVEYKVEIGQEAHVLCHCSACKIMGGAEASLNQIVDKTDLKITKGEDSLKEYHYTGDSGKDVQCYFCPNCSSHVYHHQDVMGPDKLVLRSTPLDGTKEWGAGLEIYGKDRYGWMPEVAKTIPAAP